MPEESAAATGQEQSLTTVCLVPPASHVGTGLLANDGISTEDPAAKLLLFFGFPSSAHVRHTVPGRREGRVGVLLERRRRDPALLEWAPGGRARGWELGTWLS